MNIFVLVLISRDCRRAPAPGHTLSNLYVSLNLDPGALLRIETVPLNAATCTSYFVGLPGIMSR